MTRATAGLDRTVAGPDVAEAAGPARPDPVVGDVGWLPAPAAAGRRPLVRRSPAAQAEVLRRSRITGPVTDTGADGIGPQRLRPPPPVLRRKVTVGAKVYDPGHPPDRTKIGDSATKVPVKDKPIAKALARWMLDRPEQHTFQDNPALSKFVAPLADAIWSTQPNYLIGNGTNVLPTPFPPANTFAKEGFGAVNKLVVQVPQERGDMHDIRAAMALDPRLYVAVKVDDSRRLADAAVIIEYYLGYGSRVMLLCGKPLDGYSGKARAASSVTEILFRAARNRNIAPDLQAATTGDAHTTYAAQYDQVLKDLHFTWNSEANRPEDLPYALINFRVSGHGVAAPRAPSHPELDTGTSGFRQIWNDAKNRGYWPVPVGDVPPAALLGCIVPGGSQFDGAKHPSLINYFRHVQPVLTAATPAAGPTGPTRPTLSRRQIEYGIFGRIAALIPKARAIGMRSGGLDAIAYSGIPVLSIDIAPSATDPQTARLDPAHGNTGSWKRAAKKELILPGRFHQVFMSALRDVRGIGDPGWAGTLSGEDVARVGSALVTFFGGWGDAGTTTKALKDQPVPSTAPDVLPQDVQNLMTKLDSARPDDGIEISDELAKALGIEKFASS